MASGNVNISKSQGVSSFKQSDIIAPASDVYHIDVRLETGLIHNNIRKRGRWQLVPGCAQTMEFLHAIITSHIDSKISKPPLPSTCHNSNARQQCTHKATPYPKWYTDIKGQYQSFLPIIMLRIQSSSNAGGDIATPTTPIWYWRSWFMGGMSLLHKWTTLCTLQNRCQYLKYNPRAFMRYYLPFSLKTVKLCRHCMLPS